MQELENLKYCRNKGCSRYLSVVSNPRKRCVMCNGKLRHYRGDESSVDHDSPVIIDGAAATTTGPTQVYVCAHNKDVYGPCEECGRQGKGGLVLLKTPPYHPSSRTENGAAIFSVKDVTGEECDLEKDCPVAPSSEIHIPFMLYMTWVYLAKRFKTEWIAYLQGDLPTADAPQYRLREDGMYFPEQDVSAASVSAKANAEIKPSTIAAVHSHVGMKAEWSGTDKQHWNMPIEMIVNRMGDLTNVVRVKLDCGRYQRAPGRITLLGGTAFADIGDALEDVLHVKPEPSYQGGNGKYKDAGITIIDRRHGSASVRHYNTVGEYLHDSDGNRSFDENEYWRKQDRFSRDSHESMKD